MVLRQARYTEPQFDFLRRAASCPCRAGLDTGHASQEHQDGFDLKHWGAGKKKKCGRGSLSQEGGSVLVLYSPADLGRSLSSLASVSPSMKWDHGADAGIPTSPTCEDLIRQQTQAPKTDWPKVGT